MGFSGEMDSPAVLRAPQEVESHHRSWFRSTRVASEGIRASQYWAPAGPVVPNWKSGDQFLRAEKRKGKKRNWHGNSANPKKFIKNARPPGVVKSSWEKPPPEIVSKVVMSSSRVVHAILFCLSPLTPFLSSPLHLFTSSPLRGRSSPHLSHLCVLSVSWSLVSPFLFRHAPGLDVCVPHGV
ncbi:hypothetical protein GQ53DRAFT_499455 [Thozetella sp. PMI_491]|nr:hypothetical protein GQ53DRAFT_499455 [Thozetella sp. PMI_491]